jgi:hypothetical protein
MATWIYRARRRVSQVAPDFSLLPEGVSRE